MPSSSKVFYSRTFPELGVFADILGVCQWVGETSKPVQMNLGIVEHSLVDELRNHPEMVFAIKKRTAGPRAISIKVLAEAIQVRLEEIKRIEAMVSGRTYAYEGLRVVQNTNTITVHIRWGS